jgi:threonine dehydrogenase-like Zn-dependent dehydrogenase
MIGNGGTEGGFAARLLVRNAAEGRSLFPIPDSLSDDVAALAEPLGVGMNAVNRSAVGRHDKVAVFGAGPIGLAAVATLADRGVADIVAVDLSPKRLEIARRLGATATIDAASERPFQRLRELHGEEPVLGAPMAGTDVYIEASGASAMIPRIVRHAKAEARLTVVALHDADIPLSFLTVMMKQMVIRGAMEYPDDYNDMIDLLVRKDLSPMISHRFALECFEDALAVARDPQSGGKVMIEIDG